MLYVIVFMANGFTFSSVLYCLMTSALVVITVIDERTYQIPVSMNLFIGLIGVIMTVYDYKHILSHLIGMVCVSLFLYALYYFSSGQAIGGGDIKLMAAAGLYLGWRLTVAGAFIGMFIAGIYGIGLLIFHKAKARSKLKLAPFLAYGLATASLFGEQLLLLASLGLY